MQPDSELSAERITAALGADRRFGTPLHVYPVAVSTESLALGLIRQQQAPEGTVVVADVELSARGRRGPVWVSVAGKSLAFSLVVRPELPPEGEGLLWLLASLGAAEGTAAACGLDVRVKWPNDLLVGAGRLGTVEVDALLGPGRVDAAVLTVRVNVGLSADDFPPTVQGDVTSLTLEQATCDRVSVLAAVLEGLEAHYGQSVGALLDAYRSRCDTLGRQVRALLMPYGEAAGRAADVDERGALVIDGAGEQGAVGVEVLKRLEVE